MMARQRLRRSAKKHKRRIARRESRSDSARSSHVEPQSPILQLQRVLGNQRVAQLIRAKRLTPQGKIIDLHRTRTARGVSTGGERSRGTGDDFFSSLIQRRIGDGHDLSSPRFSGDPVLEACFDNERLLRFGARGDAVRKLQQALVDAGFPLPNFGVDGIFGSETQTAVRNFQRASTIAVDGLVGPQTMGALDARFSGPTPPGPTPPGPTPPGPTPPGPTPPGPTPPGPTPATITSQTVATSPGARTRTTIGVGEEVDLTHSAGSVTWSTTAGTLSATTGATVKLTAPDTGQTVTVTGGTATITFTVVAPSGVHMDRFPGTGIKHTKDLPDSGIQTRPFLLPDNVNFSNVQYREVDIGAVTSGTYSCHSGASHDASPATLTLSSTVVAGKGTQTNARDTVYSGHCGGTAPFTPGSLSFAIPYEYKVGSGSFHRFATVDQVHTLAADASTLTTDKAGAHGDTTVTAATSAF